MSEPIDRLVVSFSGGKTSAFMAKREKQLRRYKHVVVLFCNTGEEHEKTLEYVDACDRHYGLSVVWLEAVVNPVLGEGTTHRIVDFKSASRKGEPFEAVIAKYGLPNTQYFHCTRETKLAPIKSYLRSIGWMPGTYHTAVGIRADEVDRISPKSMAEGVIYPLIEAHVTKMDVLAWELKEPVRLGIPEHYGNCKWCWKKSFRKLATVALETPEVFDFPRRMEQTHANSGRGDGDRRIFRERKTTDDIFEMARQPGFEPFVDGFPYKDERMDSGMSCGESCEIGVDSNMEVSAT